MDIDDDLVRVLAELAAITGARGLDAQGDALVSALSELRPESEAPVLLQALARLAAGQTQEAESLLRKQALAINPGSAMAHAYLGLVLHVQGRMDERDRALKIALASSDPDKDAHELASTLLATPLT